MGKSFKFKDNNYLDSTGIMHGRILLSNYLINNPKNVSTYRDAPDRQYMWVKIATATSTVPNTEFDLLFVVKGSHSSNRAQAAMVSLGITVTSSGMGNYLAEAFAGTANFNANNIYIEKNSTTINVWLKIDTNIYASWRISYLLNIGFEIFYPTVRSTTNTLPTSGFSGSSLHKTY